MPMSCRSFSPFGIDRRLGLLAVLLCPVVAQAQWYRADAPIMGTAIHVEVWHEDGARARQAIDSVLNEMRHVDAEMSPYKPASEVSKINVNAGVEPVSVSGELVRLIDTAQHVSDLTHGAFDITFASAGHLYNYREHKRPSSAALEAAVAVIDYHQITLDKTHARVGLNKAGMRIDLGGIAKGYAVERCVRLLREQGIEHALVTAGGDTRVLGDRVGRPWIVGIRHPRQDNQLITRIPLDDEAISTSGDYERFFEEQGTRYHHILNPATGDSAREVTSVSIVGPDATYTDALSTSVFVMGVERGLALIEGMAGYEALIMDHNGKLHYSSGLQPAQAGAQ